MAKQKIRIRLKAYDHRVLDQSAKRIVETAERSGAEVVGPVPLPTKLEKFTVRRSTFIDKDSHEHFEIRTHNRLIDVLNPDSKTIDTLMRLNLPAGVDIEGKRGSIHHVVVHSRVFHMQVVGSQIIQPHGGQVGRHHRLDVHQL